MMELKTAGGTRDGVIQVAGYYVHYLSKKDSTIRPSATFPSFLVHLRGGVLQVYGCWTDFRLKRMFVLPLAVVSFEFAPDSSNSAVILSLRVLVALQTCVDRLVGRIKDPELELAANQFPRGFRMLSLPARHSWKFYGSEFEISSLLLLSELKPHVICATLQQGSYPLVTRKKADIRSLKEGNPRPCQTLRILQR